MPQGVHDARIATRRIREVLPLTIEWQRHDADDDLDRRFRRVGRALGGVRDADVRLSLLKRLESRIPGSAPSLIVVRQRQESARLRLMRNLIKQLERRAPLPPRLDCLPQGVGTGSHSNGYVARVR